ncbi:MAG: hypothetical protein ACN6PN_18525, partial [Sphingobacterium sp.]
VANLDTNWKMHFFTNANMLCKKDIFQSILNKRTKSAKTHPKVSLVSPSSNGNSPHANWLKNSATAPGLHANTRSSSKFFEII